MAITVTHPYVSSVTETTPSGGVGGTIGPTEWNVAHTITGSVDLSSTTPTSGFSAGNVLYSNGTVLQVGSGVNVIGTGQLALAAGTITTTSVLGLNITGTWNNAGAVFDAPLFMNMTDTNSAANSCLVDIRSNNVTRFRAAHKLDATVGANFGSIILGNPPGSAATLNVFTLGADNQFTYLNAPGAKGAGEISFTINWESGGASASWSIGDFGGAPATISAYCNTNANGVIGWSNGINASPNTDPTVLDTIFRRRLAGTVDLRSYNNQAALGLSVYNSTGGGTPADNAQVPTNYERGTFDWTSNANVLTIGTQSSTTSNFRGVKLVGATLTCSSTGIVFTGLPTSDPHVVGQLWANSKVVTVSTG